MMTIVARSLTGVQIADLVAWYSGHQATATPPDPAAAPQACVACHGTDRLAKVDAQPCGRTQHLHRDAEIRALAEYFAALELEVSQVD